MLEWNFLWLHQIQLQDPYSLESPTLCGDDTVLNIHALSWLPQIKSQDSLVANISVAALRCPWDKMQSDGILSCFLQCGSGHISWPRAPYSSSAMDMGVLQIANSCTEIPSCWSLRTQGGWVRVGMAEALGPLASATGILCPVYPSGPYKYQFLCVSWYVKRLGSIDSTNLDFHFPPL